jgi:hypothetical protein
MILTEVSEEVVLEDDKQPIYVTHFVVIGATSRFGNNNVQIPQRNSITCNVPFNKYERSSVRTKITSTGAFVLRATDGSSAPR